MIALLATALIVTTISIALIGLMNTDLTHASIQFAVARSFYLAQAGLAEATVQASAAADPAAYTTPEQGVTVPYGSGRFTYWVDAGPADGCGPGLKTLVAEGEVDVLRRTIGARVRACAVGGTPEAAALFGVGRVQFGGATSRVYLAPYQVGTPGGGGSLGSFTEINFADSDTRVNAVSEGTGGMGAMTDLLTLRDGTFADYQLFGFPEPPDYSSNPEADPAPWISSVFGDIIKAKPTTGVVMNRCGTPRACVTVGNNLTDVLDVSNLREANDLRHVYLKGIREETLPQLALDPAVFRAQAGRNTANVEVNKIPRLALDPATLRTRAARNTANAELNNTVQLQLKTDSVYSPTEFYQVMLYLMMHPEQSLQGTVYIDGTFAFFRSADLGGVSGNVTLAVGGDLILYRNARVTIRHDLSTPAGRRMPGIVVFGTSQIAGTGPAPTMGQQACDGQGVGGSGRLVLCAGSTLTVDGLIYTQDGMAIGPGAFVDQVGAMYHNSRGTSNPSFLIQDATVVLRFDPLALSAFGTGIATLSWQQLP